MTHADKVRVHGVILAAGLSKRMGRNKLMLRLGDLPVLDRVIQAALRSLLDGVTLVTGPWWTETTCHGDLTILVNPAPHEGMARSLKMGLDAVGDADGMMALLGDQPFVTVGIIDALLAAFRTDPTRITAAAVKGRRTLPVIFPRALFSELAKVEADRGGREVIARNPSRVVTIEFGATYEDLDVDTAEDFEKARRYLETLTDT